MDPMERALRVITNTPHIREYLRERDPEALQQAEHAIPVTGLERQNDDLNRMIEDWRTLRERTDAAPPVDDMEQELLLSCVHFVRGAARRAEGAEGDVRVRMVDEWATELGLPTVTEMLTKEN